MYIHRISATGGLLRLKLTILLVEETYHLLLKRNIPPPPASDDNDVVAGAAVAVDLVCIDAPILLPLVVMMCD